MGAGNVLKVYLNWKGLPDRAKAALGYMAVVSLDDDAKPRFYVGRDTFIQIGLGRDHPADPAEGDESDQAKAARNQRSANYQAAKIVVSQLLKAGAISYFRKPAKGRQAEYYLHLDGPSQGIEAGERGTSDVPNGVRETYPAGYVKRTERGTSDVPPRSSDEDRGTPEENPEPQPGTSPAHPQAYAQAQMFPMRIPEPSPSSDNGSVPTPEWFSLLRKENVS